MKKERVNEISRFAAVGLLSTAIHYAIYYALLPYISASAAFTLGYILSFLCNYGLSSRFTFRVGTSVQRFVSFALSHATNYFIQIILLNLFIGAGVAPALAPLPVYALAVPVNYLLVRFALTRRSREHDGYWLFLMAAGFAMLWLNLMDVPTLCDDIIYRFAWHADESAPVETIDGLGSLMRSQWNHYMSTNGRFIPHLLAQTFLVFLPPVALQVADTLMFVLLVHLCATWVTGQQDRQLPAAVLVCTLLFIVFSGFRSAMLWGLGAANYLWTLVAVLSLLMALKHIDSMGTGGKYAVVLLALPVGWTHEALTLPVSMAFAAWLWDHRHCLSKHRFVTAAMLLFFAGTALCLLSPGIWLRAGDATDLRSRLVSGAVNCVSNIRVTWLLAIALLTAWMLSRRKPRIRHENRPGMATHGLAAMQGHRYEYIALAAATGIVLACGVNLERVAFFTDFIAMLLLVSLIVNTHMTQPFSLRRLTTCCCLLLLLAYAPAYIVRAENAKSWQQADQQMREPGRELIAVELPKKGQSKVKDYFREHYANSSFEFGFYCSYMAFDHNDINMRCAARLYHKRQLTFLPEDVTQRIENDSTAYADYALDDNKTLYVWRMNNSHAVRQVIFKLNNEDTSMLLPHQRLLAYKGDSYELDDFHYEVVSVGGQPYLVFTKPTTNIFRRIKDIEVVFDK